MILDECPWPDGNRPNLHVLRNALGRGFKRNEWRRVGEKTKSNPYRYHRLRGDQPMPVGGGE